MRIRSNIAALLLCVVSASVFGQDQMFRLRSELTASVQPLQQAQEVVHTEKKSGTTAVLYSLLLPGMGELYADGFDNGRYSLIAEGGLWLSYFAFQQYGSWIQTDARNFASAHAGAQISGKDDQYFVNLGNFINAYEYNDKKLRDRDIDRVYNVDAGFNWQWDSDANRKEFRAMRVSSERVLNNSQFIIAGVIVNRIVSAINAARLTRIYNQRSNDGIGSWWLESSLIESGQKIDGIRLSMVHRF
ncbi:MAG: hypothetical protein ACOYNS_01525 [Bacteroidota bacterium]